MRPGFDCVVVGAGLTGTVAAVALSRAGLSVGVIERRAVTAREAAPDTDMRALVIAAASQRILATFGLWARLAPQCEPIREIHVTERGAFGAVRLRAADAGLDAVGWACPADVLLRELTGAMRESVGEGVYAPAEFTQTETTTGGIRVHLRRNGEAIELDARLLVGADGRASAVRSALGVGVEHFSYGQQALVANLEAESPRPGTAFERFTQRGPIAMIPLGGARYVSVQCLDDAAVAHALALDDDDYLALLQRRFGERLGALSCPGPRRAHPLNRSRAHTIACDRAVLVGNAANTMHPNAAQGWNLGLRDVAALARAVRDAPDPGSADVTAAYAASRRTDHRVTVGFTDLLAQGYRSRLGALTALRRGAMWLAATMPGVRRRLVIEASGLAPLARQP